MPTFLDLPNEMRLELAYHTDGWATFTSFRHMDSTNLALLTNPRSFELGASISGPEGQHPRNRLAALVFASSTISALRFASGVFHYTGNPFIICRSRSRRHSHKPFLVPHGITDRQGVVTSVGIELLLRLTCWDTWKRYLSISEKEDSNFVLPTHSEVSRYGDRLFWSDKKDSPKQQLIQASRLQFRSASDSLEVSSLFYQEGGPWKLLYKCGSFCTSGPRRKIHDRTCLLGTPAYIFTTPKIWRRITVLFGMWIEDLFSATPDWSTFGKVKEYAALIKKGLEEIREWMDLVADINEFLNSEKRHTSPNNASSSAPQSPATFPAQCSLPLPGSDPTRFKPNFPSAFTPTYPLSPDCEILDDSDRCFSKQGISQQRRLHSTYFTGPWLPQTLGRFLAPPSFPTPPDYYTPSSTSDDPHARWTKQSLEVLLLFLEHLEEIAEWPRGTPLIEEHRGVWLAPGGSYVCGFCEEVADVEDLEEHCHFIKQDPSSRYHNIPRYQRILFFRWFLEKVGKEVEDVPEEVVRRVVSVVLDSGEYPEFELGEFHSALDDLLPVQAGQENVWRCLRPWFENPRVPSFSGIEGIEHTSIVKALVRDDLKMQPEEYSPTALSTRHPLGAPIGRVLLEHELRGIPFKGVPFFLRHDPGTVQPKDFCITAWQGKALHLLSYSGVRRMGMEEECHGCRHLSSLNVTWEMPLEGCWRIPADPLCINSIFGGIPERLADGQVFERRHLQLVATWLAALEDEAHVLHPSPSKKRNLDICLISRHLRLKTATALLELLNEADFAALPHDYRHFMASFLMDKGEYHSNAALHGLLAPILDRPPARTSFSPAVWEEVKLNTLPPLRLEPASRPASQGFQIDSWRPSEAMPEYVPLEHELRAFPFEIFPFDIDPPFGISMQLKTTKELNAWLRCGSRVKRTRTCLRCDRGWRLDGGRVLAGACEVQVGEERKGCWGCRVRGRKCLD
ncbi:hypothetical protein BJ508DRAFT_327430 [Ascobolus immersus RN42]|uniref:Uncharacterized protein n=1 Tax=Ascobolus immersus RN42 TaxID=1160509 RepID=A0A3N4I2I7_ASCIM|nr:hypothetical protein BJ508DRAFT_327430 [Ascobolus immersus RN42]